MGARGRGARPALRTLPANQRRTAAYREPIVECGHQYWDLCLGAESTYGRYWPDPLCDERRAAWAEWKDKIRGRFPFDWSNGNRPAAWVDFDLPPLLEAAVKSGRFTAEQIEGMSVEECVFHFDSDEDERQQIEEGWRHRVRCGYGLDGVPRWFQDQANPPAKVAPLRRRARR